MKRYYKVLDKNDSITHNIYFKDLLGLGQTQWSKDFNKAFSTLCLQTNTNTGASLTDGQKRVLSSELRSSLVMDSEDFKDFVVLLHFLADNPSASAIDKKKFMFAKVYYSRNLPEYNLRSKCPVPSYITHNNKLVSLLKKEAMDMPEKSSVTDEDIIKTWAATVYQHYFSDIASIGDSEMEKHFSHIVDKEYSDWSDFIDSFIIPRVDLDYVLSEARKGEFIYPHFTLPDANGLYHTEDLVF